jgi:hypothetical protein
LAGAPGNRHFSKLFELARNHINLEQYQSVGSPFYKQVVDMESPSVFNFDIRTVYPTRAALVLFNQPASRFKNEVICNDVIGLHWYAGAPESGKAQNYITENTYRDYDNIVCHLLRNVNDGKIIRG